MTPVVSPTPKPIAPPASVKPKRDHAPLLGAVAGEAAVAREESLGVLAVARATCAIGVERCPACALV
jgi:hypothetical protein